MGEWEPFRCTEIWLSGNLSKSLGIFPTIWSAALDPQATECCFRNLWQNEKKQMLTFAPVPKWRSWHCLLGTGKPGWNSAPNNVRAKRSTITNFETKPHILAAFLGPTSSMSGESILSESIKIRSTEKVSPNGWTWSKPFAHFYEKQNR